MVLRSSDKNERTMRWFYFEYPGAWNEVSISLEKSPLFYALYDCYPSLDDPFPDEQEIRLVPLYKCPKGYTSLGINEGCIQNEKLICAGDVLGRDLNIDSKLLEFIKREGHVGISIFSPSQIGNMGKPYEPLKVAEMLTESDDEPSLTISTIESFKKKVENRYWGAKFGTENKPNNMNISQYLEIKKLLDFILEEEVKYTWTWNYNIRRTTKSYIYNPYSAVPVIVNWTYPSMFICDTLVKYLYEIGAKIKLELKPLFSPKDLFSILISARDNSHPISSISSSPSYSKCSGNLIELQKKINEKLLPKSYAELNALDSCMKALKKVDGDTKQKVNFIWSIYKKNKGGFLASYMLDALIAYKTLDLTEQFIEELKKTHNYNLINLLVENLRFNTEDEIHKLNIKDIEHLIMIYDFLGINEKNFPKNEYHFNAKIKAKIYKNIKHVYGAKRIDPLVA